MKNVDISRQTFDPRKGFSRVVIQQGRVQLDADFNEQTAIMLYAMRNMMRDLVGPGAGPEAGCGFEVFVPNEPLPDTLSEDDTTRATHLLTECEPGDFIVAKGRYYVDGLPCENHDYFLFSRQHGEGEPRGITEAGRYLVYLDVWEQEVTALDDDSIREIALGGPDTAARAALTWRVRVIAVKSSDGANGTLDTMNPSWRDWTDVWQPRFRGALKARAKEPDTRADDSRFTAQATYRGPENQLYRVEIHDGGKNEAGNRPTFKFSRDNGIVAFRIEEVSDGGLGVTLQDWGRDDTWALNVGDWVESLQEDDLLLDRAGAMLRVEAVSPANRQVTLSGNAPREKPVVLRRWDQKAGESKKGGLMLSGGAALIHEDHWQTLEDGVEIMFQKAHGHTYRAGDYWLIPARVATSDVLWPHHDGEPAVLPPTGVEHHYAPLAIIDVAADQSPTSVVVPLTLKFGFRGLKDYDRDVLTRG